MSDAESGRVLFRPSTMVLLLAILVGIAFLYSPTRIHYYEAGFTSRDPGLWRIASVFQCQVITEWQRYMSFPEARGAILHLIPAFVRPVAHDLALLCGYITLSQVLFLFFAPVPRSLRVAAIALLGAAAAFSVLDGLSTPAEERPYEYERVTRGVGLVLEPIAFLLAGATLVLRNRELEPAADQINR